MSFYFYVLRSEVDGTYYKGHASDVRHRTKKHNWAESKSTKSRRPWKLVYTEEFATRSEAIQRERLLKSPAGWKEWKSIVKEIESR